MTFCQLYQTMPAVVKTGHNCFLLALYKHGKNSKTLANWGPVKYRYLMI
jgi:hypothetical protein